MVFDWPSAEELQKECGPLLYPAFLRGFTLDLLTRVYMARAFATGTMPSCREFLQAIARGEFDYLFFSKSQSLN
jgi:hypothetical protein